MAGAADGAGEAGDSDAGDERLRAAVAAWMASGEGEPETDGADRPAAGRLVDQPTSVIRTATSPEAGAEDGEGGPDGAGGSDEATAPSVAGADDPEGPEDRDDADEMSPGPLRDQQTRMFRAVTPPEPAASSTEDAATQANDSEDEPERAEATEAATETGGDVPTDADERAAEDENGAEDEDADIAAEAGGAEAESEGGEDPRAVDEAGDADDESRGPLGDERTKVFRAVTPPASVPSKDSAADAEDPGDEPEHSEDSDTEAGAKAGAEDGDPDRTDADKADAKAGAGAETDADADAAEDTGPAAKATATATDAEAKAGAEADQDADAGKTDAAAKADSADAKAAEDPGAEAGAEPDRAAATALVTEAPAERTSRFVPLPPEVEVSGRTVTSGARTGTTTAPRPGEVPPVPSHRPGAGPLQESERTKKQPLPPAPPEGAPDPLDLLAQLTNTPPPPETPLRVAVRRIKIWSPLVVLLLIVFTIAQAVRPLPEPELVLTARSTYAFEGERPVLPWPAEGQAYVEIPGLGSLGASGEEKPVPIASVAKVMTAYVILRDHPIKPGGKGKTLTVDAKTVSDYRTGKAGNESVVEVKEGQKLSEYEALQALMLPSANNVARLLARWDAGSEKAFVDKMNDAARDLGMKNTEYTDPSGLDRTTVSTAKDQVKLGRKVMENPVFREISRQPSYEDSLGNRQDNYNRLVPYTGTGIKTGTSTAAGGNLLFSAEQTVGGTTQLIVGSVLGQHRAPIIDTVTAVSKKLIEAVQGSLESRTIVRKGQVVGRVDDGLGGTTPVVATKDVKAVGWPGLKVDLALTDNGNTIPHVAKAGTRVGTLTVGSGPGQVRVPVETGRALTEPTFGSKLTRIL